MIWHIRLSNGIQRRAWRYPRGNQNPYIEEQTTQWTKEQGQKDKQRSTKEEDTTGLIRIRTKEKNRQHNGQKNKDKRTNKDLQKKSLKIPQGWSESIFGRRTDNTMDKRTRTKGQTTIYKRRVWRYQRVNQNPYLEEEQTTQWSKEKKYKTSNNDR